LALKLFRNCCNIPISQVTEPGVPFRSNLRYGLFWVFEASKAGKYKVVGRWAPHNGPVRDLGLAMLIDVAKLKLLYQEVY
jgi:hypothetical protein